MSIPYPPFSKSSSCLLEARPRLPSYPDNMAGIHSAASTESGCVVVWSVVGEVVNVEIQRYDTSPWANSVEIRGTGKLKLCQRQFDTHALERLV